MLRTEVPTFPPAPIEADAHAAITRDLIDLTRRRLEESVRFQHALAVFLQQITGLVETRDRALGGTDVRTEIVQMRARTQELARDAERARRRGSPAAIPQQTRHADPNRRGPAEIAALERLQDASLPALEVRDLVEYLDAAELVRYLDLAFQKLRPAARLTIDAINGASWDAFFGKFIRDTARIQVLHPETLRFLVERAGFSGVSLIVPKSAAPDSLPRAAEPADPGLQAIAATINAHADRLNRRLFSARTFTVTAFR